MRWQAKLIVVASLASWPCAAAARDTPDNDFHVTLTYQRQGSTRQCWDQAEFQRSVAQRLGYDPFRPGPGFSVSIRVAGSARAVEGHIDWRDAGGANIGERKLTAKDGDCQRLLTEVSFAVGLQIELLHPRTALASTPPPGPAVAKDEAGSSSAGVPSGSSAPVGGSTPEPEPPPAPPTSPRSAEDVPVPRVDPSAAIPPPVTAMRGGPWSWSVGAGPAAAWGVAPSPTAEGRVLVRLRWRDLSFEVAGQTTYPITDRQADGSAFRQRLIGGGLGLCGHRRWIVACALGRGSQVRIRGLDVDLPHAPDGVAVQAGGRLGTGLLFGGGWSVMAHAEVLGLITPYRVILNQRGVWDMPSLAILAGAVVEARFR